MPDRVNILIVDDKPENLMVLEELLAQPDRQLHRASNGTEALRLLLKYEFSLVLLDVQMPIMDGFETAQLMQGAESTRLIPIIFITAGDRSTERAFRGYEAGAVDFLYKPVDAHTLKSKVHVFVELARKTRQLARVNAELEWTTQRLHEQVADLENVSQTLSHDLRAPLRSIRAFSQILEESARAKLDPDELDALDRVRRGSERLSAMIDDLYRLLKISANIAVSDEVDAAAVFRDVLDNLQADLDDAGVTVSVGELPTIRGNRMLLGQVFQNLLANAIKFRRGEHPTVHVSATRRGDTWHFGVRDDGIGIPVADRERVFKLFHRASSEGPGTGVGLALCRRAVERLGGKIWIDPATHDGTLVWFTAPAYVAAT